MNLKNYLAALISMLFIGCGGGDAEQKPLTTEITVDKAVPLSFFTNSFLGVEVKGFLRDLLQIPPYVFHITPSDKNPLSGSCSNSGSVEFYGDIDDSYVITTSSKYTFVFNECSFYEGNQTETLTLLNGKLILSYSQLPEGYTLPGSNSSSSEGVSPFEFGVSARYENYQNNDLTVNGDLTYTTNSNFDDQHVTKINIDYLSAKVDGASGVTFIHEDYLYSFTSAPSDQSIEINGNIELIDEKTAAEDLGNQHFGRFLIETVVPLQISFGSDNSLIAYGEFIIHGKGNSSIRINYEGGSDVLLLDLDGDGVIDETLNTDLLRRSHAD